MKHAKTVEEMLAILGEVAEWLKAPEQTGLRLALVEWIRRVLLPLRAPHATLPAMVDLMEAKRVMAEQTIDWGRPWKEEGKKEGLRTGVQKGEATLLIRQMRTKFGPVPRTVQQKIASADARTLLKWGDRVLSATRLEEVFE
jgi:hypothetical protein